MESIGNSTMPTGSLNGSSKPRRSSHHNHVVLGRSLTGHLALGVHLEACIQHGIRDLIADLIRVASELRREASGIFGDLRCSKKNQSLPSALDLRSPTPRRRGRCAWCGPSSERARPWRLRSVIVQPRIETKTGNGCGWLRAALLRGYKLT